MEELTVSKARARLADVVDEARVQHAPVYLTRRGKRVAAVISADDLDLLIAAAGELASQQSKQARNKKKNGQPVTWQDVRTHLRLPGPVKAHAHSGDTAEAG